MFLTTKSMPGNRGAETTGPNVDDRAVRPAEFVSMTLTQIQALIGGHSLGNPDGPLKGPSNTDHS